MPNRILKESICSSDSIDPLTPEAETFFYRLIVNADDYGRFDARPAIIIARCFPLRAATYTENLIKSWLNELVKQNLIHLYQVEQKEFLQIVTWNKHQQIRAKRSKYPDPSQLPLIDNNGNQLIADDSICPRNPIQSNPIREAESNTRSGIQYEKRNPTQADAPLKKLITDDNKIAKIPESSELTAIIKAFEECGGSIATPMIAQLISDAEGEYGSEIVIAAFKKAAGNGKKGVSLLNYCRPIFEQYKLEGIPDNKGHSKNYSPAHKKFKSAPDDIWRGTNADS